MCVCVRERQRIRVCVGVREHVRERVPLTFTNKQAGGVDGIDDSAAIAQERPILARCKTLVVLAEMVHRVAKTHHLRIP